MGKDKSGRAQSMIELAVFGSVLIFLVGGIAMNYLGAASQQESQLQAMRIALAKSYHSSKAQTMNRSSATYISVEDRLTGGFGKYGTSDRQPVVASGNGAFSIQMMMPLDFGEAQNLSVLDLSVNGQTFVMTTSGFVKYAIRKVGESKVEVYRYKSDEDITCKSLKTLVVAKRVSVATDPFIGQATARLLREWPAGMDFPPAYRALVSNDAAFGGFADGDGSFDYDRDGDEDLKSKDDQAKAYWRWSKNTQPEVVEKINFDEGSFPSYDIDGDLKEETIYNLTQCPDDDLYFVNILDQEVGDVNLSRLDTEYSDRSQKPGLQKDMNIQTFTACIKTQGGDACDEEVTSLTVKEGSKFSNSGLVPVSASSIKKEQYDIVQRIYQMNPAMIDPEGFLSRNKDVVEKSCKAASCPENFCTSSANAAYTCFDGATKKLYIRSRISDQRGRKWITNTGQTFQQTLGDRE